MAISETKMQIVIANYFKDECDVNTSIKQAFEKGFRIGVKKGANTNRPQGWIPCGERLPKAEEKVWIQTERGKVCFAMYEDGTISEDDSAWHWYDLHFDKWDEENDCGIIPEGWWEWTEFHPDVEFDCPVDEVVVAWMPLPKPYKERSK